MSPKRTLQKQKTLAKKIHASGIGLFTGEKVSVTILPSPVGSGISLQRVDLVDKPIIPAKLDCVKEAPRCTRLCKGKASILMVEHLLSALYAYGVDNALIQVEGPEIPAGDGSAEEFARLIEEVGLVEQTAPRLFMRVKEPLFWSEGEIHLIALPAPTFRLSYTLHYPHSPLLKSQYYSFTLSSPKAYREEISRCRTFSLYEEILPFIEKGLIRGGGLENALLIHGDKVLNPGGAHYPDEMVRHKILDLMGDLSLIGAPLLAHVIAIRSGHGTNVAFASKLVSSLVLEEEGWDMEKRILFPSSRYVEEKTS